MRMLSIVLAAAVAATVPLSPTSSLAAPPVIQAPAPIDAAAIVAEVRRVIAERYVLPERRPALDAVLAEGLSSGRYAVEEPSLLAERINADLERVGRDRHLTFRFDPRSAAAITANAGGTPDFSAYDRHVRLTNHGVAELKVLPGNVRVMTYNGFEWSGPETAAALDNAMRFLSGGDAVIIDLRGNGGGSPQAVQYLISHFLPADRPLVTFYMNGEAEPDGLVALAELPAGRMIGKPLYVLTSGGTASAAEEFSGHVAGYGVGELVGANTAGAGFRNDNVPIAGQFVISVSVGRAVLAATGKDWEAVGHAPTVPTEVPVALDVAYARALTRLADAGPADERARLEALADAATARAQPRRAALPLTAYAGTYGERAIRVEGDHLVFQRGLRAPQRLISLGGHRFAGDTDPSLQLEFDASAGAAGAMLVQRAGEPVQGPYERTVVAGG